MKKPPAIADAFDREASFAIYEGRRGKPVGGGTATSIYTVGITCHEKPVRQRIRRQHPNQRLPYYSEEMVRGCLEAASAHYKVRLSKDALQRPWYVTRDKETGTLTVLTDVARSELLSVFHSTCRSNTRPFRDYAVKALVLMLATEGSRSKYLSTQSATEALREVIETEAAPNRSKLFRTRQCASSAVEHVPEVPVVDNLAEVGDGSDYVIDDSIRASPHLPYIRYAVEHGVFGMSLFDKDYLKRHGLSSQSGTALEQHLGIAANRAVAPDLSLIPVAGLVRGKEEEELKTRCKRSHAVSLRDKAPSWVVTGSRNSFVHAYGRFSQTENADTFTGIMAPSYLDAKRKVQRGTGICNGTRIVVHGKDIIMIYDYSADTRPDRDTRVPKSLRQDNLAIAEWRDMEEEFNAKFDCGGVAIHQSRNASSEKAGICDCIVFLRPITWDDVLEGLKTKNKWFKFDPGTTVTSNHQKWHYSLRITQTGIKHFCDEVCVLENRMVKVTESFFG